ncbi:MAG: type II toxin-antitoxin system VapC family toxin [Planctomycetota bacterium]|nr:MAG: type II toxin-antitoxin system VapC family toxin [Planctomycetota bacterium]
MILLDTDMMSLFASGHPAVVARVRTATEPVAITIVTRIEILQGRFDFLLKAANAEQLQRAQSWLEQSERDLAKIRIVAIDRAAAADFEDLRQHKKLRKIGRADLLIASIARARNATLATGNLRHFQQVPGLRLENWLE